MDLSRARTSQHLLLVAIWCFWWCLPSGAFVGRVQQPGARPSPHSSKSTTVRHALEAEDEDIFAAGDKVVLTGPDAMKGKKGIIVERVDENAFSVQLESGSTFNIKEDLIADAGGGFGGGIRNIFGGGGGGGGGAGKPPSGSGSAGDPSKNFGGLELWQLLPVLVGALYVGSLFVSWLVENGKVKLPSLRKVKLPRFRVDKKPFSWNSSLGSSPLGALLILAAVGIFLAVQKYLPGVMEWLQDQFTSTKVVIAEHVPFTANVVEDEEDGISLLDALLFVAVAVLTIGWVGSRLKKRRAAGAKLPRCLQKPSKGNPNEGDASSRSSSYSSLPMVGDFKPQLDRNVNPSLLDGLWPLASKSDPTIEVTFVVNMVSAPGDRLLVVGGHDHLGKWTAERSMVELSTSPESYPIWKGKWYAPATITDYDFKLVLVNEVGEYYWEKDEVANRSVSVSPFRGAQTVEMKFNKPGFQYAGIQELISSPLAGN